MVMVARPGVTVFAGWSPIRPAEPVCAMEGAGIEGRCDATVRPIGKRIRAQASEWSMFVTRVKKATPTATHLRIGYLHDIRRRCPLYRSKGLCRSLAFDEFGCGRAGNVRFHEDTARGQTGRALSFQDVDLYFCVSEERTFPGPTEVRLHSCAYDSDVSPASAAYALMIAANRPGKRASTSAHRE